MAEERIQKILAQAGFGSRRSCEDLILGGRVKVNGKVAELGAKADSAEDQIQVDGQTIPKLPSAVYIALHKPQGVLSDVETHNDPRKTVRDLVPVPGHLFSVGRLDYESEGLILMTNDGELANQLTHPRYGHEKEYRVLLSNKPDNQQLEGWRHGIVLEDGHRTQPAEVRLESSAGKGVWLRVVLREGRKRQIREMGRLTGLQVQRILRIRIGSLLLGDMKPGEWRYLRPEEIRLLKKRSGAPSATRPPRPARRPAPKPAPKPASRPSTGSKPARRGEKRS